jgi:serpin B
MNLYIIALMLTVSTAGAALGEPIPVSGAGTAFALELYSRLAEKEGNLFFSPTSIHTALCMTAAGAGNRTAVQMAETLHVETIDPEIHTAFAALIETLNRPKMVKAYHMVDDQPTQIDTPAYQLVIANALWGQQGYRWKQDFLNVITGSYGAGLQEVDFAGQTEAARNTINEWVEKKTRDRIMDLIGPGGLDAITRLILTNAIYFKADWAEKFPDHMTEEMPFTVSAKKKIVTSMMFQKDDFRYMETDAFQALEMPYNAYELSMVAFLPKTVDGLGRFEKTLAPQMLSAWLETLATEEVEVTFPKFEFTSSLRLSRILKAMGMKDAFSPSSADFSGMTSAEKVFISDVIHKAFVAVDEEGTEAAAATAIMMAGSAMRMPASTPTVFKADHPFLFIIRHNRSGAILFMGRVVNPKQMASDE